MSVIRLRVSASDIRHLKKGQDLVYANGALIIHYESPKKPLTSKPKETNNP
jgi:hypothetical protein